MEVATLCLDRLLKKNRLSHRKDEKAPYHRIMLYHSRDLPFIQRLAVVLVSVTFLLIPSYVSASVIKEFDLRSSLDHICIFWCLCILWHGPAAEDLGLLLSRSSVIPLYSTVVNTSHSTDRRWNMYMQRAHITLMSECDQFANITVKSLARDYKLSKKWTELQRRQLPQHSRTRKQSNNT